MYHLYIDESGDEGDYLDENENVIDGSSRYFTLGGIIVNDSDDQKFVDAYNDIITNYFSGITLPSNFKLHYHPLRNKHSPYDQLKDEDRWKIPNDVFDIIKNLDCHLLSVTIDLDNHCKRYPNPVNPRAYALLLILERFQYFVEEQGSTGRAIYERFNAKMRKKAEMELKWLKKIPTFPTPTNLSRLNKHVESGDPTAQPILNFADFFAYLPYLRRESNGKATKRWDEINFKYYNFNGGWLKTGWVEL